MYEKEVAPSDKPADKYHPTLKCLSVLRSVSASFSSFFWFRRRNFQTQRAAGFSNETQTTVQDLPSTTQQTDKISGKLGELGKLDNHQKNKLKESEYWTYIHHSR